MIMKYYRLKSTTKPHPVADNLYRLYEVHEQITWKDNTDIFYMGMYSSRSSSVGTFLVRIYET